VWVVLWHTEEQCGLFCGTLRSSVDSVSGKSLFSRVVMYIDMLLRLM